MVQLSRFLCSVALLGAALASPFKRTVAQLEADIKSIGVQVTTLDNDITSFPITSGTLVQVLVRLISMFCSRCMRISRPPFQGIHMALTNLANVITTANTELLSGPTGTLDEADAADVLAQLEAIEPTFLHALFEFSIKEPGFGSAVSAGPALILGDLRTLKTDTDAFLKAIIAVVPTDLKEEATEILNALDDGFSGGIAPYS
ncbi:hydrophobic surface binding protein [Mycena capillaripes]|nr:hydrophobic surface binding protein [Mycena capillaripes]